MRHHILRLATTAGITALLSGGLIAATASAATYPAHDGRTHFVHGEYSHFDRNHRDHDGLFGNDRSRFDRDHWDHHGLFGNDRSRFGRDHRDHDDRLGDGDDASCSYRYHRDFNGSGHSLLTRGTPEDRCGAFARR